MPDTGGGSSSACLVLAPPINYHGISKANLVPAKRRKSIDEHAPASNWHIGGGTDAMQRATAIPLWQYVNLRFTS